MHGLFIECNFMYLIAIQLHMLSAELFNFGFIQMRIIILISNNIIYIRIII